jgi:alpha-tubulin suppressor-like RCC1 family protein
VTDGREKPRLEIVRQCVALEQAARLVNRGRDLAVALAGSSFLSVAAARHRTLALATDSSLWAWGRNHRGQLGFGDLEDRDRPTRVGDDSDWASVAASDEHTVALKRDGSLWAWGGNHRGQLGFGDLEDPDRPTRVGDDSDWASVGVGWGHSIALKRDGSLWAWGENLYGELGLGDAISSRPVRLPRLRLR